MKLISISIRGAIGLKKIGDEIFIDFTKYQSGPIALIGPNESGKTTLLENLTPFRSLFSHKGSLTKHFYLPDSHRDLRVEMNGDEYRFLLKIDAIKGHIDSCAYKNGHILNEDAKSHSYNKIVDELFGPEQLFYKSVFYPQTTEKDNGWMSLEYADRKKMFIEMLNLGHFQVMSDKFKDYANSVKAEIDILEPQIHQKESDTAIISDLEIEIDTIKSNRSKLQTEIDKLKQDKQRVESELAKLRELRAQQESVKKQIDNYSDQLNRVSAEQLTVRNKYDVEEKRLTVLISETKNKIRQCSELMKSRAEIDRALELKKEQARLIAQKEKLASDHLQIENKRQKLINEHEREYNRYNKLIEICNSKIDQAEKVSGVLDDVPCQSLESEFAEKCLLSCPLIANAVDAKDVISRETNKIHGYIVEQSELDDIPIGSLGEDINKVVHQIEQLHDQIQDPKYIIDLLGRKNVDLEFVQKAKSNFTEASMKHESYSRELEQLEHQYNNLKDNYESQIESIRSQIENIKEEKAELKIQYNTDIYCDIEWSNTALNNINDSIATNEKQILNYERALSAKENDLNRLRDLSEVLKKDKHKLNELRSDYGEWRMLQEAFGRNGIQAYELRDASEPISMLASEILKVFERNSSLELITTRPDAKGKKQVDVFDIIIHTPDGQKTYDDLSGGAKTWVRVALQKAIAIHLNQNSGRQILTAYADETDGAFDSFGKSAAYYQAMTKVLELAGLQHILFISHDPEVYEQSGQMIIFKPGKHRIEEVF